MPFLIITHYILIISANPQVMRIWPQMATHSPLNLKIIQLKLLEQLMSVKLGLRDNVVNMGLRSCCSPSVSQCAWLGHHQGNRQERWVDTAGSSSHHSPPLSLSKATDRAHIHILLQMQCTHYYNILYADDHNLYSIQYILNIFKTFIYSCRGDTVGINFSQYNNIL